MTIEKSAKAIRRATAAALDQTVFSDIKSDSIALHLAGEKGEIHSRCSQHFIQVSLERFKLTLNLASPLTSFESIVMSVFDVISNVTAMNSFY